MDSGTDFDVHAGSLLLGDHQPSNEDLQKVLEYGISLSRENKSLHMDITKLRKECSELRVEKEQMSSRLEDEKTVKLEVSYQNKLLEKSGTNLELRIGELKLENKLILSKLEEKEKRGDRKHQKLFKELNDLYDQVKNLEEKVSVQKKKKRFYKSRFIHFRDNCDTLNSIIQKISNENISELERLTTERETLDSRINDLKMLNLRRISEIRRKDVELEKLLSGKQILQAENEKLNERCDIMSMNLDEAQQELRDMKNKNERGCNIKEFNYGRNSSKTITRFRKQVEMLKKRLDSENREKKFLMEEHFEWLLTNIKTLFSKKKRYRDFLDTLHALDLSNLYEKALREDIGMENWYQYIGKSVRSKLDRKIRFLHMKRLDDKNISNASDDDILRF